MDTDLELYWQKDERLKDEKAENDKLDELEDHEMWCSVCGSNMDITDDECSVCGC